MENNAYYQDGWAAYFLNMEGLPFTPAPANTLRAAHWHQGWSDADDFEQEMNDG